MSGGRHDYGLFFASALIPLLALGFQRVVHRLLRREDERLPKSIAGFSRPGAVRGIPPRFDHGLGLLERRNNTRIFASTQVIVLLVSFVLLLAAPAIVRGGFSGDPDPSALFSIITCGGYALLALVYASRKGDLGWVETISDSRDHEAGGEIVAKEADE